MMRPDTETAAQADADCPECCCILEVCCNEAAAREALIQKQMTDLGCSREDAEAHGDWTLKHFALAPKSMRHVIRDIVQMAKDHKP